jgi:hypothetical protein
MQTISWARLSFTTPPLILFSNGPSIDPRAEHTATFFTSGPLAGQVLITGGLELEGDTRIALNDQQLYDPATNGVSSTGFMNDARGQHTATLLNNGLVLVTGGYDENFDNNGFNEATATAELYNPSNAGLGVERGEQVDGAVAQVVRCPALADLLVRPRRRQFVHYDQ